MPFASQLLSAAAERAPLPLEELLFCALLWLQLNARSGPGLGLGFGFGSGFGFGFGLGFGLGFGVF